MSGAYIAATTATTFKEGVLLFVLGGLTSDGVLTWNCQRENNEIAKIEEVIYKDGQAYTLGRHNEQTLVETVICAFSKKNIPNNPRPIAPMKTLRSIEKQSTHSEV